MSPRISRPLHRGLLLRSHRAAQARASSCCWAVLKNAKTRHTAGCVLASHPSLINQYMPIGAGASRKAANFIGMGHAACEHADRAGRSIGIDGRSVRLLCLAGTNRGTAVNGTQPIGTQGVAWLVQSGSLGLRPLVTRRQTADQAQSGTMTRV